VAYATVEELQVLLSKPTLTAVETTQAERVLEVAATEIDWELGYTTAAPAPSPPPDLVVQVNLERAVEHWRQLKSPFGIIGAAGETTEPIVTARNSWYRHHLKLAALKVHQGVA
jgi:hypothetical protein